MLLSSVELVMSRGPTARPHPIPPITDPMGQHWNQPDRFLIEIDDTHALMSQETCDKLHNYAHSAPSGVYPGKMWKWHCKGGNTWCPCKPGQPAYLKWYGEIFTKNGAEYCSGHSREILIV